MLERRICVNASSAAFVLLAPFRDHFTEPASIYVVDDEEDLTKLYQIILEEKGYQVKTFTNRAEALAALKGERRKPELLILDYLGHAMPAERFVECCLRVHPTLRILMASGLNAVERLFGESKPDEFIQKPFTAEGLLGAIRALLVA